MRGTPTFDNVKDTGIPSLQSWCRQITRASRDSQASHFLEDLIRFLQNVNDFVSAENLEKEDIEFLKSRWETKSLSGKEGSENRQHRMSYWLSDSGDDSERESDGTEYGIRRAERAELLSAETTAIATKLNGVSSGHFVTSGDRLTSSNRILKEWLRRRLPILKKSLKEGWNGRAGMVR